MDDLQIRKIEKACLIIGDSLQRALDAFRAAAEAFAQVNAANALGVDLDRVWEDEKNEAYAELLQKIRELGTMATLDDLSELAEDKDIILPPKKMPRPPKCIGPVNKANHTANRPPRVARSNCRIIKR